MNDFTTILGQRQREVEERLDRSWQPETEKPVMGTGNLRYELSTRVRAISAGGIGVIEQLVEAVGLRRAIDERVHVFKRHLPYHESDHVLTMVYNLLTGGQVIEDIGLLREDTGFLDAVGAQRLPGPSTSGDFLRRLEASVIENLMEAQNDARLRVCGNSVRASVSKRSSTSMAPSSRRRVRRKTGADVLIQREVRLRPVARHAGEHGRGTLRGEPFRQPALPRRCGPTGSIVPWSLRGPAGLRKCFSGETPTSR